MQLDDPSRGFSVKNDGPLDLRMDDRLARTGAQVVNSMKETELAAALRDLADEPDADAIAHAIVTRRYAQPFVRTFDLVDAVFEAKHLTRAEWRASAARRARAIHPATLTFQALRMVVNDELGNLRELLRVAPLCLRPGGRFVVISFHSGEDRLVKEAFRSGVEAGVYAAIADEPLRPSAEELAANTRASPARLRFAVRAAPIDEPIA
jgi:16S rRNA (cytosine1402-N4)-methyltransferase